MSVINPSPTAAITAFGNRLTAIVARQRASRLRDLLFAGALAVGFALSVGALHAAAADADAPVATAPAHVDAAAV